MTINNHKKWLSLLIGSILALLILTPIENFFEKNVLQEKRRLNTTKDERLTQIQNWEQDTLTATILQDEKRSKDILSYLQKTNRTRLMERIELLAAASGVLDFTYTLSPSAQWSGNRAFPSFTDVTESRLTFRANVPYEEAIYHFLDSFQNLKIHAEIDKITLARSPAPKLGLRNLIVNGEIKLMMNDERGQIK